MEIFEIEKKTANWGDNPFNYQIGQTTDGVAAFKELTVTVTLAEYRELVTKAAISGADLDKMRKRAEEAEEKLRQQIEETQAVRAALRASSAAGTEG